MDGRFYVVATPIGNLKDISFRAVEILKSVDFIACEDTRITKILADKYSLKAALLDCHKFNEKERSGKILNLLKSGNDIALVSDAGTPNISDPGSILINELIKANIKIIPVPGACAVTAFLSVIPRKNAEYAFIGFIPRTKNKQIEILKKYKYTNLVFYESPVRLKQTLKNIAEEFGENTQIAMARELTKVFEEVKTGSVKEIIDYYDKNPLKGEIAAMVFAREQTETDYDDLLNKIEILKQDGFSPKNTARIISKLFNINKNTAYNLALNSK